MGEWLTGLEVVLHDGSVARTGAWAISDVPYGQPPLPGLGGLFVGWLGTTGIVTRGSLAVWPEPACRRRLFVMAYSHQGTFETVRTLCRQQICDDIGGLSWPSGKMMLGVQRPHPEPQSGEPTYFLYLDLSGCCQREVDLRCDILDETLDQMRNKGHRLEAPMDVEDLVGLDPALGRFAHFPTRLDFLLDHPGEGLTWVGTYGPLARFEQGIEAGIAPMVEAGYAPTIVSRPMKGGHFGVLRFVMTFDRKDPEERKRVREVNRKVLEAVLPLGFVMYKPPAWAVPTLFDRMDPGTRRLMQDVKGLMDPKRIFNPHNWGL
jgi:glycolate oxidase